MDEQGESNDETDAAFVGAVELYYRYKLEEGKLTEEGGAHSNAFSQ